MGRQKSFSSGLLYVTRDGSVHLLSIIEEISRSEKLPFIVIGGYAVIAWGVPRQTIDLDLLVAKDAQEAWKTALCARGFQLESEQAAFTQFHSQAFGRIDLMHVQLATFEKMHGASELKALNGTAVRVASIPHLIALKLHALKHGESERKFKDFTDVLRLVHIAGMNVRGEEFKALCEKHGTEQLYEEIVYFSS